MEHREAVLETLESPSPPAQVLLASSLYAEKTEFWEDLSRRSSSQWYLLEDQALEGLLSVKGCSGLCGLYRPAEREFESLLKESFILLTWEIQDPGNLGTIIRSCSGLAGGAVLAIGGCNPWSSKVARASAGALFRAPLSHLSSDQGEGALHALASAGYSIFAAVPRGGVSPSLVDWTERDVLLVGNETHGVPRPLVERVVPVTISMTSETESLNAGVAASLLIYERQRSD
jgi:TrmH family RNA methyltransferase